MAREALDVLKNVEAFFGGALPAVLRPSLRRILPDGLLQQYPDKAAEVMAPVAEAQGSEH